VFALLNVHLTGGDPWWQELVGPVLLAATAIAAAWIAAKTANRRQAAQLANDQKLQKEQLAYDREQRNRQHQRDTVDRAVGCVDAAMKAMAYYDTAISTYDSERTEYRETRDDESAPNSERLAAAEAFKEEMDRVHKRRESVFESSLELGSESLRLMLRFGKEHPIVTSHAALCKAFDAHDDVLRDLHDRPLTDEEREAIDGGSKRLGEAWEAFLGACREWFEAG
jgi:hypothetical protein